VIDKPLETVTFLVTGNIHKFAEARVVLSEFGLSTVMLNVDAVEIQADSVERVAEASVMDAVRRCCLPVIVEDAGLFISALKGFPGPYSSYVFRTIGAEGVLKLMKNVNDRGAFFESAVAFSVPGWNSSKLFRGRTEGIIMDQMKGHGGFGYDPIFAPAGGGGKTFAEMSVDVKNRFSHRGKALRAFAEWYLAEF